MKIALLHLDLSGGPEDKNIDLLCCAIKKAAERGAKWVVTPETAVQGYFFTQMNREYRILVQPSAILEPFFKLAREYAITIFLGCAEHDEIDGKDYNSCLVIDSTGKIIGRHRKMRSHGSGAEGWASKGNLLEPIMCDDINTGVLVCADAWYGEHGEILRQKGAEVIIVIAAWPPGCGGPPEDAWERCSARSGGLPVILCNQTGTTNGMNCTIAKSAIVIAGKIQTTYNGAEQAILIANLDLDKQKLLQSDFEKISIGEGRSK